MAPGSHVEHSIRSADGTRLRLFQWTPPEPAGRDVLLVHGLAEHADRYHHVAAALNAAGHRATLVELRGHGRSEGRRGHVRRWQDYVDDVVAAARFVRGEMFIVAHSMGGLVVLDGLRGGPLREHAVAVAVSNPLLGVAFDPPKVKEAAAGLLSRLLPWLSLSNELDVNLISRDKAVVAAYEADPLVFDTITPRWYTEMLGARKRVHAHAGRYDLPGLAMVGTGDGICDHRATVSLMERWGHPDHEVKRYEGLYHELFNEPEKERVLADLVAWLGARDQP
ncbi:MAG: alpha/beta hydrolase [Deltaproteobacteria bacterium]|nr:MAG: alpha/beta hydrolase [Deltaproteobacteria bacterium]